MHSALTSAAPYLQPRLCLRTEGNMCHTHSAASKNIPSDVAVMQQPRVSGAFTEPTVHLGCVDRSTQHLGLGTGNGLEPDGSCEGGAK